jgi:hypothetical protein
MALPAGRHGRGALAEQFAYHNAETAPVEQMRVAPRAAAKDCGKKCLRPDLLPADRSHYDGFCGGIFEAARPCAARTGRKD